VLANAADWSLVNEMGHWQRRLVAGNWFNVGRQSAKAQANIRKHQGVGFAEAMTVLEDRWRARSRKRQRARNARRSLA
jgi:hypothetical protein